MRSRRSPYKLVVLTSHPIQYQAPLFRALAQRPEIELEVHFCCEQGVQKYKDPEFQVSFRWDVPLLEGYRHTFLRNVSPRPGSGRFWGTLNPGIFHAIRDCNALWVPGWAQASSWIGWLAALAHRLPVLVRGDSNGLAEPIGVKGAIKRRVLKIFFSRIAGFLAIGTHNANFYRSYGVPEERLFWTPYAVDNDFFGEQVTNFAEQRYLLRAKEGIPPEPPAILFCGKFVDKKRPLDLLRAFAALGTGVESSLIFVGDGPLRPAMEDFVASQRLERVFFLGFRNQTELPACYALADVLVLPSSFEPWGLVLNEAMASGLPVIASERVGAAADLIRQGVNGFVFPVGDVSALTHYLRTILKDRCAREEMGRQSRVIVSGWGLSESVNGVLKALDSIVR